MFIYREDYYRGAESRKPKIAEILIKKHRNGPTGDAELYFDDERVTFHNLEKNATAEPPAGVEVIQPF
jgi:replicative DNA helicase